MDQGFQIAQAKIARSGIKKHQGIVPLQPVMGRALHSKKKCI